MEAGLLISFPGGDDNCRLIFWMRCFGLGRGKEGLCVRWWLPMTPIFFISEQRQPIRDCALQLPIFAPCKKSFFHWGEQPKLPTCRCTLDKNYGMAMQVRT